MVLLDKIWQHPEERPRTGYKENKVELFVLAKFQNELGEISQDQAITSLLELIQYVLLGNALYIAHKLASLLYTECLQSHKMLFFCFILLV